MGKTCSVKKELKRFSPLNIIQQNEKEEIETTFDSESFIFGVAFLECIRVFNLDDF